MSAVADLIAGERAEARKLALDEARRTVAREVHSYKPGSIEERVVEACVAELDRLRGAK